jgi:hypothetical protein
MVCDIPGFQRNSSSAGLWGKLVPQIFSAGSKAFDPNFLVALFMGLRAFVGVSMSPPEQAVDQGGQFPRGREDRPAASDSPRYVAVVSPQGRLAVT